MRTMTLVIMGLMLNLIIGGILPFVTSGGTQQQYLNAITAFDTKSDTLNQKTEKTQNETNWFNVVPEGIVALAEAGLNTLLFAGTIAWIFITSMMPIPNMGTGNNATENIFIIFIKFIIIMFNTFIAVKVYKVWKYGK